MDMILNSIKNIFKFFMLWTLLISILGFIAGIFFTVNVLKEYGMQCNFKDINKTQVQKF